MFYLRQTVLANYKYRGFNSISKAILLFYPYFGLFYSFYLCSDRNF